LVDAARWFLGRQAAGEIQTQAPVAGSCCSHGNRTCLRCAAPVLADHGRPVGAAARPSVAIAVRSRNVRPRNSVLIKRRATPSVP